MSHDCLLNCGRLPAILKIFDFFCLSCFSVKSVSTKTWVTRAKARGQPGGMVKGKDSSDVIRPSSCGEQGSGGCG